MTEPRLYIVMREDLWDCNPGKGMAQAAHAQAEFDEYLSAQVSRELAAQVSGEFDTFWQAVSDWRQDRNFGVTLVLSAPKTEWHTITEGVIHYGIVTDPTYPYRNHYGKVFTASEDTCMWVFATTEEEVEHMQKWRLHP